MIILPGQRLQAASYVCSGPLQGPRTGRVEQTYSSFDRSVELCAYSRHLDGAQQNLAFLPPAPEFESQQTLAFFAPHTRIGFGFPAGAAFSQNLNI
jgi:hypothetical protein